MTTLPSDLDVARQLSSVRASVIEATRHVRSPKRSTRYRTTRNLIIAAAAVAVLTAGAIVVIQYAKRHRQRRRPATRGPILDSMLVLVAGEHGSTATTRSSSAASIWQNDMFDQANNNDPDPNDGTSPDPAPGRMHGPGRDRRGVPVRRGREDFCETLGLADWDSD